MLLFLYYQQNEKVALKQLIYKEIYVILKLYKGSDFMGRHSNYQSGRFFDEIEKLNKKLDRLISTNSELNITIYNLRLEIKSLNKQLDEAHELNKKLQEDNDRLKNQINKNSSNSSKSSSSNFTTPIPSFEIEI